MAARRPWYGSLPSGRRARHLLSRLPKPDALVRRQIVLVRRLHVESGIPGIGVPGRADDAEFGRAVRVRQNLLAQPPGAVFRAPHLREGQEEALVAGVAVEYRRRLSGQRDVIGLQ